MLKRFRHYTKEIARKILKEEIESRDRLISRLVKYARPYAPDLIDDGTDQSYNLQYRIDVGIGFIPIGNYNIGNNVTLGDDI